MKKGVVFCLLLLLVKGYGLFSTLPTEIVVGYHEDFPPYFQEIDGKVVGIFPEMIDAAAAKLGIHVKYNRYPWKRLLRVAEAGEVHAIFPLLKTKEREKYLAFGDSGLAVTEVLFFARKNLGVKYSGDLQDLKEYSIGVVGEYDYGEELKNASYLQKIECPSDEKLVEMLINKRFQVGLSAGEVVKSYALKFRVFHKIDFLEPPLLRKVLFIGFSKKKSGEELAGKFSEAIAELRNDGTHQHILEKFERGEDIAFFKEIVIGADLEDYPPYSYWQENGQEKKPVGIGPEIINRIAENIGLKILYQEIEWGKLRDLIEKEKINAVMPLFKTQTREKYLLYPESGLVAEKNYFITWKNCGIRYSGDLHDLKGIPIGVVDNYSYGETFDSARYLTKASFRRIENLMISFKNKKVKIAVGEGRVLQYFIDKLAIADKVEILKPPLPREFLYLAFSRLKGKRYEKLATSFSDGIKELMRSGEHQAILRKYGIKKRTVLLAADNRQPYYGNNLPGNGPIAEIVREAFKRADYEVNIEFIPWADLLDKVKKGELDSGFAACAGIKQEEKYYLSDSIGRSSPLVFLKRADANIIYTGLQDLRDQHYRIGVVRDFAYEPGFDKAQGLQRIVSDNETVNIRNLLEGRLDLVIIDEAQALDLLDKMSDSENRKLEFIDLYPDKKEADTMQELHLLISKESVDAEQLIIDFNHGLKKMKEEGIFDRILKKLEKKGERDENP